MNTIRSVCVYCGSSPGHDPAYVEAGRTLGRALAHSSLRLVYGGERLDEVVITDNMHQRKQRMFEESDAFVALPGGIGTVEEIVEMMTWAQLGHHRKPMVFANIGGFWDPMLTLLDHMRDEGFIHTAHQVRPLVVNEVEAIVPAVLSAASAIGTPA